MTHKSSLSDLKQYSPDDFHNVIVEKISLSDNSVLKNLIDIFVRLFDNDSNNYKKTIQDTINLLKEEKKLTYFIQLYGVLNDSKQNNENDLFFNEKKTLHKLINLLIKRTLKTYLIDNCSYSVHGWSKKMLDDSIKKWIENDYKSKTKLYPSIDLSEWNKYYSFIINLFDAFSQSFTNSIIHNSLIDYTKYIQYTISDDHKILFSFSNDDFIKIIKQKFNIEHITFLLQEYTHEYDTILSDELGALVQEYDIKINTNIIMKKYSVGAKNSSVYAKDIHDIFDYKSVIQKLQDDLIAESADISCSSDDLIHYYFTLFSFFCSEQFHNILKDIYKQMIKEKLSKAYSTKINDAKKNKEKKQKKIQLMTPFVEEENTLSFVSDQGEEKNKKVLQIINEILNKSNFTSNIQGEIHVYISKMIKNKTKNIGLISWLKQKKYSLDPKAIDIIDLITCMLYDYGYNVAINKEITKEAVGGGKPEEGITKSNDTTTSHEKSRNEKVVKFTLSGDNPYEQLISYFKTIMGGTICNNSSFIKKLNTLHINEVEITVKKIQSRQQDHENIRYKDYKNGYSVMKFELTNARIVKRNNTIIDIYCDHDRRVSIIMPKIISGTLR